MPDETIRARLSAAREATTTVDEKAAARLARDGKLHVRDRIALLFDTGTFVEDGRLANATATGLPADGVVTGQGLVDGRPALVMANDPTVKAGSWGARTVEKMVRLTEKALSSDLPIFWFVDSAGARLTDQVQLFPGRRGAGRIFHNQVALSGRVPQICCLFGPSAAGGAYIPSFCDVVFMVEKNASMYLGSPRMAEEVINEHVTLEEMGGARMHATVSGCGDNLCVDDADAMAAMVEQVTRDLGPVDLLVCNAGIASRGHSVADTDPDELVRVLHTHAVGAHHACRLVLQGVRSAARGDIVMISSVAAHSHGANGAPYSMGKAAIESLAYTLAKEELANGIHVNIVAPGLVETDMGVRLARAIYARRDMDDLRELDASFPFGRVCQPSDVADVVTYLCSDGAGYLTGQRIVVDGGAGSARSR